MMRATELARNIYPGTGAIAKAERKAFKLGRGSMDMSVILMANVLQTLGSRPEDYLCPEDWHEIRDAIRVLKERGDWPL